MQDEIGDFLIQVQCARMADPQAQPPEARRAERGTDVLQSVVTGVSASQLHLALSRQQVEFVVHDQDLVRCDAVEGGQGRDRAAGPVHVRAGLEQPDRAAMHARTGHVAMELGLARKPCAVGLRDRVHPPEAGVVAGVFVFGADVAQADNESYGGHEIP
jgi:hypothetical protein